MMFLVCHELVPKAVAIVVLKKSSVRALFHARPAFRDLRGLV